MATPSALNSGQVTVTVTSAPEATDAAPTTSSTLSLIYIYSTSASAQPTDSSSSQNSRSRVSGGAVAGIVVGSIAFLVLLSLALFCYSRKVARRKRAEASISQRSRSGGPSRATTAAMTMTTASGQRDTQYVRSTGERSMTPGTGTGTVSMSLKTPSPVPPKYPPPAELPTSHDSSQARLVHVVRDKPSRPELAEMYGSYTHPAELHGGSTTDLFSEVAAMKQMKAAQRSPSGQDSRREQYQSSSDAGSVGYMTPEPGWHPNAGLGSDGTETEYGGTEAGTVDAASIHIYYRSSAATIAQAMSQASLRASQRVPRIAMRRNSIPLSSQTSLADTAR